MPLVGSPAAHVILPIHHEDQARSHPSSISGASCVTRSTKATKGSKRSGARRYSRLSFQSAENTHAVLKINENVFDALSTEDIQQLFDVLDKGNRGIIVWDEFALFLREVLDPPFNEAEVEAIFNFTDQRPDGMVTAEEISRAFKHPVIKLQVAQLHQNYKVKKEFTASQGVRAEVGRDLLIERLDWRVRKDDAFATLPFSLVLTVIFILLVVCHLQIWNRQQVERGLESWIEGYGHDLTGPYLKEAVAGTASHWAWLATSGLGAVFGECGDTSGTPLCRISTRNVLIGDAQLRQARATGAARAAWLLHSEAARLHLAARPQDYLGAAAQTLRRLEGSGWIDEDTDSLQLVFSTYNEHSRMFATTEVTVGFDSTGYVEPVVVSSAVIADPYPGVAIFVLDALYVCCILYPLYAEARELGSWCRAIGCLKGIRGYGGFWNGVDWLNIAMGIVQSYNWIQCYLAIRTDSIQELIRGDVRREQVHPDVMGLDTDALEIIRDDLAHVIWLFFCLHVTMAVSVFIIMLKFFKAFQANPKLQLVTNTLTNAASDIFHFCIVAFAVFVAYAMIGHILFGGDLVTFNTIRRSLNTVFTVLMGDFAWYCQESESDVGLGSGVPWFLVVLWFWSFMVFNFLILMNMLMAIILEHYADCFNQVKSDPDACALWVQGKRYVKQLRRTQGFVSLSQLLCQLVDQTQTAHPGEKVTMSSLMEALHVPAAQAVVLMDWLSKEAKKRMQETEGGQDKQLARMVQVEGFMEGMAEILRIISLNVSQCNKALQEIQQGAVPAEDEDAARPEQDAGAGFAQTLDVHNEHMEDLNEVVSVLRDVMAHLGPQLSHRGSRRSSPEPALVGHSGTWRSASGKERL